MRIVNRASGVVRALFGSAVKKEATAVYVANEYLDFFNDRMERIGVASRADVHERGYWHQTFHCWIIKREAGKEYVLFQRRSLHKDMNPGLLDISAAGHLLAGEGAEAGMRELNEELGLDASFSDLTYLGVRCDVSMSGQRINREFNHVFLLENNTSLDQFRLQPEEVTGIVQMEVASGLRLFSGQVGEISVSGVLTSPTGTKSYTEFPITIADIVPSIDRYYMKVLIMTQRYFEGNRCLAI